MGMTLVPAGNAHTGWLIVHDGDVPERWIRRCISLGEYLIAELDGEPVGFLRFSWFWGKIPFMDMIRVNPARQRSGVGSALFARWEAMMRDAGATLLMTSSQDDEPQAQAWHRRNGFSDSGAIIFGHTQPVAEIFLIKDIR